MQAEKDEAKLNEAQQEAEDAAELEAMRESGLISEQLAGSSAKPAGTLSCSVFAETRNDS